ncbi:putative ABC transporter dipeptide/oligopeptide binding protein [Frankia canadensis]|uniref:Putative ABC transporter dipeptide/oligopeptide binding protein n=1 Tax=Frankia canadensis TaxID=1836972 RepID=A0A2I2KZK7_9ACTN|nr:ABC transporter substrate-binding protein [Frankia canadensis]SNQ51089.1 putative ABC transporter dipeptide/oligopeptide binding protein [Frankia canadensis]SOU58379.1 putative ABC transporter dipeptide/oligopeptide binding protein [Frankia canadensis]
MASTVFGLRKGGKRRPLMLAATLSAALVLAACGSGGGSTGGAAGAAGSPVRGGTLTFAINSDGNCLDPHQSPADVDGFFARSIVDSLVALSDDGTLSPWLAKSWTVSADQKTYSFVLRDDVTFSNGEKFDAAAVKANLDHIVAPTTKSQLAAGTIATYTGTTVIDATHAEVRFSAPNSAFLPSLATAYLGIEAPSTLKKPPADLCTKIVGSGPFISTGGYVKGKGIDYVRNDRYNWAPGNAKHTGPAHLNALSIRSIPEDSSRYGALTSGQVDAIASVPPVNVAALKRTPGFTIQTAAAPGGNYNYYPNTTRGPFTDVKVREAFRVGIDWSTIVQKLYFGVFPPARGPLSPSTVGYDKTIESSYAYDKAKANQLLDQAGWTGRDGQGYRTKDGERLTLVHPFLKEYTREQRDVVADQVQAAAKDIGIEVKTENPDYAGFLKNVIAGDYDLLDMSWQRASPDALRTLFGSAAVPKTGFATNLSRFTDPALDKIFADALNTTDLTRQAQLYGDAQQRITAAAAVFPVYVFHYVLGSSTKVQGLRFEPQAFPLFYDAWTTR